MKNLRHDWHLQIRSECVYSLSTYTLKHVFCAHTYLHTHNKHKNFPPDAANVCVEETLETPCCVTWYHVTLTWSSFMITERGDSHGLSPQKKPSLGTVLTWLRVFSCVSQNWSGNKYDHWCLLTEAEIVCECVTPPYPPTSVRYMLLNNSFNERRLRNLSVKYWHWIEICFLFSNSFLTEMCLHRIYKQICASETNKILLRNGHQLKASDANKTHKEFFLNLAQNHFHLYLLHSFVV